MCAKFYVCSFLSFSLLNGVLFKHAYCSHFSPGSWGSSMVCVPGSYLFVAKIRMLHTLVEALPQNSNDAWVYPQRHQHFHLPPAAHRWEWEVHLLAGLWWQGCGIIAVFLPKFWKWPVWLWSLLHANTKVVGVPLRQTRSCWTNAGPLNCIHHQRLMLLSDLKIWGTVCGSTHL